MSRMLAPLLIPVVLLTVAPAAPVPKRKPVPLYWPTKVGTKRVYSDGRQEFTFVVTKVEWKDGVAVVTTADPKADEALGLQRTEVSEAGLARLSVGGMDYPVPEWLLKLPFEAGAKWDFCYGAKSETKGTMAALGREKVEVPAGTFEAVKVVREYANPDQQDTATYWFAPEVGTVKSAQGKHVWVLTRFEHGKE